MVIIQFNQKLRVPSFIDTPSEIGEVLSSGQSSRRRMISLFELDVDRDVFEFTYLLNSDIIREAVQYSLLLTHWDEDGMEIFINFRDPLVVSRGIDEDRVILKVLNKNFFISKDGERMLLSERKFLQSNIPQQNLPEYDDYDFRALARAVV